MLEYLVVKTDPTAPTLIILHGFGADEYDLISVAKAFPPLNIISLRAPIELPWGGYAWYQLEQTPEGLRGDEVTRLQADQLLTLAIPEVLRAEQLDPSNIILLGFSQGSAMSYDIVSNPQDGITIKAVVILSGYIPAKTKELLLQQNLHDLPFFISHGEDDDLISLSALDEAKEVLLQAKAEVTANKYPIGHSISDEVLSDLSRWFSEHHV
ncbi:MAG TPA: dienelactone hydrolase family protein [Candidatus Kapabacteria bacterium]|nr:dienelactone hydrolase family protein [Candidatus Kapabacteria bacterium]